MQNIIHSVQINSRVAAAEGWSVTQVANCIMQLVQKERDRMEAVLDRLDQKLREYAGSDYEQVKNLHPSEFGDEPWEQDCAEVISTQMDVWDAMYHDVPCAIEVAWCLDVEPSSSFISCVEQLNSQFSYWGWNIVGRD